MKSRNFGYFFKEGTRNIFVNGLMSLASVSMVLVSLFLLGIFSVFSYSVNYIVEDIKNDCEIRAYVEEDLSEKEAEALLKQVKKCSPSIREVVYVSKDEAYDEAVDIVGEEVVAGFSRKDHPFRRSFKVTLSNLSDNEAVAEKLKDIDGIYSVANKQEAVDTLLKISNLIRWIIFWLILILTIIAVFIISNTIRIALFSRRLEISIMKYVGATDWFVRWPFIIEGVLIGLAGAIAASLLIWLGYDAVYAVVLGKTTAISLPSGSSFMGMIAGGLILCGAAMGSIGGLITIRKHLRV